MISGGPPAPLLKLSSQFELVEDLASHGTGEYAGALAARRRNRCDSVHGLGRALHGSSDRGADSCSQRAHLHKRCTHNSNPFLATPEAPLLDLTQRFRLSHHPDAELTA